MPAARPHISTPMQILGGPIAAGGHLVSWYVANDGTIATGINGCRDRAGNGDYSQATGSKQPADSTLLGRRCSFSDGSDDYLLATLTNTIPSGARPFFWMVCAVGTFAGGGTFYGGIVRTSDESSFQLFGPRVDSGGNVTVGAGGSTGDTIQVESGSAGAGHLIGCGNINSTTGRAEEDGTLKNGTVTVAANQIGAKVVLHATNTTTTSNNLSCKIAEYVLTDAEPSSDVRARLRNYFRAKYRNLTIGP
jgi:hypothetical protein